MCQLVKIQHHRIGLTFTESLWNVGFCVVFCEREEGIDFHLYIYFSYLCKLNGYNYRERGHKEVEWCKSSAETIIQRWRHLVQSNKCSHCVIIDHILIKYWPKCHVVIEELFSKSKCVSLTWKHNFSYFWHCFSTT